MQFLPTRTLWEQGMCVSEWARERCGDLFGVQANFLAGVKS
jgi:hypothetical protein